MTLPDRVRRSNLVAWSAIAAGVTVQTLLLHRLDPARMPLVPSLIDQLAYLPVWAAATPFILRSAGRWPLRGPRLVAHLGRHLVHAGLFIVATNVLLRVPFFLDAEGLQLVRLLRGALLGVATFGPWALMAYGIILGIGDRLSRADVADADCTPVEAAPRKALSLRCGDEIRIVPFTEIEWIEADDNHVRVAARGQVHRARERLADIEARLDGRLFIRVHRSAIVPVAGVRVVERINHGDWLVHLAGGRRIRVARSRRPMVDAALAQGAGAVQNRSMGRYSAST